ncbi:PKD-like domain-containing protein [Mucilaginibacter aquariorum]|uniref:T9SS type B sorting domain-containing protein n=1 Tax=Mucilaginibacter aquariorum TaxID=2967225 RepID=A0ABT1SZH5_9SPHI|nr:PKD-like domain-containing protein [Mucilaginibacter aquariorum]MCQ6957734.1 T9SS type B sorting domain-containing protein [Mucilaginibacter aquariorum]
MPKQILIFLFILLPFIGYGQNCTLSATISSTGPTICSGNSIVLTANPSGGTGPYTYIWSTGETTPSISVNKEGTYIVNVSDKTPGCSVKANKVISSIITPGAPRASNQTVCPNTPATLTATGPGGEYRWYDVPTGGTALTTGSTYQTPPITQRTIYYVETTISGCTSTRTAVTANVTGKPITQGVTICPGNPAPLSASGGDSYTWYDVATGGTPLGFEPTFVTPVLFSTKIYYVVAIINGCTSARTPVTAKVTAAPQAPTTSPPPAACTGSVVTLHANAPDGIFDWFDVPTGGTSLISSPDYTTPPLTATTTYYVQTTINGCESSRTPVTVIITSPPTPPQPQSVSICSGSSVPLIADSAPTGTYAWYDQATGGILLKEGVTYQTPVLTSSTIYYVQHMNGACSSERTPIEVVVKPPPAPPSASEPIICSGYGATLTASSLGGGTFQWYNVPTGGTSLFSGAVYTTPALTADATYYVQTTESGCVSERTAVKVTVLAPVPVPTVPAASVCAGDQVTLTASGSPDNYEWYDVATGGTPLITGPVYVTPGLTTTKTYYVQSTANDCTSERVAVPVTVTPIPAAPIVGNQSVCPGSSAHLTVNVPGGTAEWYAAASGGAPLATGNTFDTPVLFRATTYYVRAVSGTCVSGRTPVTVSMIDVLSLQFSYASGTFCTASANAKPVINNPSGGTFSATPAGLVFVSNTTGEINIAASIPGKYAVTFTYGGTCPGNSSVNITITSTPNAQFTYAKSSYCQGGTNPLPVFGVGATAGAFTGSSPNLVFRDRSTGEIDLDASKPGLYTIKNTIGADSGCPEVSFEQQITIDPQIIVNAGPEKPVSVGSSVQLGGSISSGTGKWSGPGSFSDVSDPRATYTPPANGATTVTLTLKSDAPAGTCGQLSSTVTIHINTIPAAPTAGGTTVCMGSIARLQPTAPGGTYNWFDVPAGGNSLFTGPIFNTPPITANTIYYVEVTKNGLTSSRTSVNVTVTQTPAAPQFDNPPVCAGNPAVLTARGSTGTYKWFDVPVGGSPLSIDAVFTTPILTANKTYYVQTTVNSCTSERVPVNVTVNPAPHITSQASGIACSGVPFSYNIEASAASTFSWSRAVVPGVSNAAATDVTTGPLTETLISTVNTPVIVKYIITPTANGCAGPPFTYQVTVNPLPVVTNSSTASVCNDTPHNFTINLEPAGAGTSVSWSRAAVAGISNAAVTGQTAPIIKEVLHNTTTASIDVTYVFNYKTANCDGPPFNLVMTVKPEAKIISDDTGIACSGTPQNYAIQSNIPSATFSWKRDAVANISNPAVTNQTNNVIDESLINTGTIPVKVTYIITPFAFDCAGTPFNYIVTVNPQPAMPVAKSNSPVCVNNTIQLRTATVPNASYQWTGPNGYISTQQNPDITNVTTANNGTYNLFVIVNDCTSPAGSVDVKVNALPVVKAGPILKQCGDKPVQLIGSITGGTTTGYWEPKGAASGDFSPSRLNDNANQPKYIPSPADLAAGSVTLTLISTSKDNCTSATADVTINFGQVSATSAGLDREVCSQDATVKLEGVKRSGYDGDVVWKTSGTGTFSSATDLDAFYNPSAADVQAGSVILSLTALTPSDCYTATDRMTLKFIPPPTVNAGGIRYILPGKAITLTPSVSDENVQYLWSPAIGLSSTTVKNPVLTGGNTDQDYTLQITDSRGCVNTDKTKILVSPTLTIPNTFTPNGDGNNDFWNILGLVAYQDAVVDIFNRYGQQLFHSIGYSKAWDGTYNGKPVPAGTYYYKIDTKLNSQVLSGYVLVVR